MHIQRTIEVLSYIGLLMCSLGFVWNSLEDYMSALTSYSTTEEPLTVSDLPTVSVCLKSPETQERYSYGDDLNITARIIENNEYNVTLIEDQKVKASPSLLIHLSEMVLGWGQQDFFILGEDTISNSSSNRNPARIPHHACVCNE